MANSNSNNYICGQYEDAFTPNRLCNWSCPPKLNSNYKQNCRRSCFPSKLLRTNKCSRTASLPTYLDGLCNLEPYNKIPTTEFIADDNGHLFKQNNQNFCTNNCSRWLYDEEKYDYCKRTQNLQPWNVIPKFYKKIPTKKKSDDINIDRLFNELKKRWEELPIIWIFGFPQASKQTRYNFTHKLSKRLNFKCLDMDAEILLWNSNSNLYHDFLKMSNRFSKSEITRKPMTSEQQYKIPKYLKTVQDRATRMSKRLISNRCERLQLRGVLEMIKLAMILHYPTNGYILMNFPFNIEEAEEFERVFWPVTTGIYFMDSPWSSNLQESSSSSLEYNKAYRFKRDDTYLESKVERCCDVFGYKCIKVLNAENIQKEHFQRLDELVNMFLSSVPKMVIGKRSRLFEEPFPHSGMNHPIIVEGPHRPPDNIVVKSVKKTSKPKPSDDHRKDPIKSKDKENDDDEEEDENEDSPATPEEIAKAIAAAAKATTGFF